MNLGSSDGRSTQAAVVQLWRFLPRRSARRTAHRQILRGRRTWGWAWTCRRVKRAVHRCDWWAPLLAALVLSAPLGWYMGKQPGWVDQGWQVSAVLLGFVIALVVFLLQVVISRSVRSERSYRAILHQSRVAWPTVFALVFLGWSAAIERWATPTSPPAAAWVMTWSVCFFGVQLVSLLAVFAGTRRLLAPSGVVRALEQALRIDIDRGVEERLTRVRSVELFADAMNKAGAPQEPSFRGFPVRVARTGHIDDYDLRLPRHLKRHDVIGELALWSSLAIGDRVNAQAVIATFRHKPNAVTERVVRAGVRVGNRGRKRQDWLDAFGDIVDLGLKAIEEGVEREVALATAAIAASLTEVAHAYRRFGEEYNVESVHRTVWRRYEEDEMFARLQEMSSRAAMSNRPETFVSLVALPYDLAERAIEDDVELLFEQALRLWVEQATQARTITAEQVRDAAIDRVHRLSSAIARQLVNQFQSEHATASERELSARYLKRINSFRARLLKGHVDANDVAAFRGLFGDMTAGGLPFDPVGEARRLRQRLNVQAVEGEERTQLLRELSETEATARLFTDIVEERSWDLFMLGAWTAWQYQRDGTSQETWEEVSRRLDRPFGVSGAADRLAEMVTSRARTWELDRWYADSLEMRSTSSSWQPKGTDIAMFWATLLLLRHADPGTKPVLPVENALVYLDHVRAQLDAVERDAERWSHFVRPGLPEKVQLIRDALDETRQLTVEQLNKEIADAPISDDVIKTFSELARQAFDQAGTLRRRVRDAGALGIEAAAEAGGAEPGVIRTMPKRAFVGDGMGAKAEAMSLGRSAAALEEHALYQQLAELAQAADETEGVPEAIDRAIEKLKMDGFSPDVIIFPADYYPPTDLTAAPAFEWSEVDDDALAYLEGIPILGVGPMGSATILVCDLQKAIRVKEWSDEAGDPLQSEVLLVTAELAAEMLDNGQVRETPGQERKDAIEELQRIRVVGYAYLDYEIATAGADGQPVLSISIRPEHN